MENINALALHRMGDPRSYREAVRSLEFMLPESRLDVNCIVHDSDLPFPSYLKDIDFDLIVLGPTFLCNRYSSTALKRVLTEYDFIRESYACKVALPQDDYDCSGILDQWLYNWNIDRIYTVIPNNWDVLYPLCSKIKEIKLGFTGYVSDKWIDSWASIKPFELRSVDVSYRASKLPAYFGSIGQLKWQIATNFLDAIQQTSSDLKLDISIDPKDFISGTNWHAFIEDSKFCLNAPSGSSILDKFGLIGECVRNYVLKHPCASFEEIEKHCFPGQDRIYEMTAISPRNIESALAGTVQLATPGNYSGLLKPMEHYIPLNEDCSNINEVLKFINNRELVNQIQINCKETILSEPRLRLKTIADEIISYTQNLITQRSLPRHTKNNFEYIYKKYYEELPSLSSNYWFKKRIQSNIKNSFVKLSSSIGAQSILRSAWNKYK